MPAIAAIKTLVVVMGVLIVLGLGLLAYGVMRSAGTLAPETEAGTAAGMGTAPPAAAFGLRALDEPPGTRLNHVTGDGAGRVLLGLSGGGRPDRVVVIDGRDGRRLGTVLVGPDTAR